MAKQKMDVSRHLASRSAVKRVLDRHRIVIVSKKFADGGVTTRVLIDGEYYDVDNRQLDLLEMGQSPQQICLEPTVRH